MKICLKKRAYLVQSKTFVLLQVWSLQLLKYWLASIFQVSSYFKFRPNTNTFWLETHCPAVLLRDEDHSTHDWFDKRNKLDLTKTERERERDVDGPDAQQTSTSEHLDWETDALLVLSQKLHWKVQTNISFIWNRRCHWSLEFQRETKSKSGKETCSIGQKNIQIQWQNINMDGNIYVWAGDGYILL